MATADRAMAGSRLGPGARPSHRTRTARWALAAGALTLALTGCHPPRDARPLLSPIATAPVGPQGMGPEGVASNADLPRVATDWWRALGDPQLDRIMAEALAANPSLAEAEARIRLARAGVSAQAASLLPSVTAQASVERERFSNAYIYPPSFGGGSFWIGQTEADLAWSADLAGRQKALVAAARAGAESSELDAAAARVSLSGAVAQAYINLARACRQIAIAGSVVANREESLRLARTRREARLSSDLDLRTAETLLAQARQAQVRAEGSRVLMVHALAALAGRGADAYAGIADPALDPARALEVPHALPADLIGRRADVLAARSRVEALLAARRAAKAAYAPDVDLRAFAGTLSLGLSSLLSSLAFTAGVGPAVHLPIFEGGKLAAQYRGAVAGLDVAVARYNQAVLQAVKEAADAIAASDTARADAEQQTQVLAGLEDVERLNRVRVATGLATRFDELTTGERVLAARQAMADIAADGAVQRVRLLVALGGGFQPVSTGGSHAPAR